jgi:hypothetical protein
MSLATLRAPVQAVGHAARRVVQAASEGHAAPPGTCGIRECTVAGIVTRLAVGRARPRERATAATLVTKCRAALPHAGSEMPTGTLAIGTARELGGCTVM